MRGSRSLLADDDFNIEPASYSSSHSSSSSSLDMELTRLATNFLLYVAMVIITTMICRLYFPWTVHVSLQSPSSSSPSSHPQTKDRPDDAANKNNPRSAAGARVTATETLIDVDDDSEDDDSSAFLSPPSQSNPHYYVPTSLNHNPNAASSTPLQTESPAVVFRRLCLCSLGLILTFVMWGILQERMLTRRYPRYTGEYFQYTYFLVFTNRLWSLLFSLALLLRSPHGLRWCPGTAIYDYSYPSISNMLSSWCQYEALKYVSFPAQTLFKSFKIAPVMLMGKYLSGRTYPGHDYVAAFIVGGGIAMFMTAAENVSFVSGVVRESSVEGGGTTTAAGIVLLALFLLFDSFTGQWQARMFNTFPSLSVPELLFATNAFSTVLSLITLVHEKELGPALDFVYEHSEIHLHFFLFSLCSTAGQMLIFYTIKNFGAVVFAIIMTVRVLVSIVVSCLLYDHPMTGQGLLGFALVMCGVAYRVKKKAEGGDLMRFARISTESAQDVVHQWHSHIEL